MTPEEFLDAIREEHRTALSRLGSSKSLYADTEGEMETDAVLATAADAAGAAAETFDAWAEDESGPVGDFFATVADEEREHYDTVVGELGDHEPGDVPAVYDHLRGLDGTIERLGGFVGRTLVADKSTEQRVGFFVGQADPQTSRTFRDIRGDVEAQLERATDVLTERCASEEDWERAREAASGAIQTAYDEYFETLEAMGVNPKPVC